MNVSLKQSPSKGHLCCCHLFAIPLVCNYQQNSTYYKATLGYNTWVSRAKETFMTNTSRQPLICLPCRTPRLAGTFKIFLLGRTLRELAWHSLLFPFPSSVIDAHKLRLQILPSYWRVTWQHWHWQMLVCSSPTQLDLRSNQGHMNTTLVRVGDTVVSNQCGLSTGATFTLMEQIKLEAPSLCIKLEE